MLRALDAFEEVVTNTTGTIDFLMREGELLFRTTNARFMHTHRSGAATSHHV